MDILMKKTNKARFFWCIFSILSLAVMYGNNIAVSNIELTGINSGEDYAYVEFDLTWENSWRTDDLNGDGVTNWDAAWVFVKFKGSTGGWKHAKLFDAGHNSGTGTSSSIQIGLPYENGVYHATDNPGVGAFFYRSANGSGTYNISNAKLKWNYGADGVSDDEVVTVKVFAIEMVYVPEGSFYAGDGGTEVGSFYTYPTTSSPYHITSENEITVGTESGNLYYPSSTYAGDQSGPIPSTFPKGYAGFYCMKYEVTQQQYVDYLNAFFDTPYNDDQQASYRANKFSTYRHSLSGNGIGNYTTSNPYIAKNYISWADAIYFASWACLRPMTELEYEKACRGTITPVVHEYAWGTSNSTLVAYTLSNINASNETIATNYSYGTSTGNSVYSNTKVSGYNGPLRVGIFATVSSNRVEAGASYYGIMELSGNLKEFTITVGHPNGRSFSHYHGDGSYSIPDTWPGESSSLKGVGDRGGGWMSSFSFQRVSKRSTASNTINSDYCYEYAGFRAVRSLPPF